MGARDQRVAASSRLRGAFSAARTSAPSRRDLQVPRDGQHAGTHRHVSDPRTMELPPSALLDPDYPASRARLIDRKRAQDFGPGDPPRGGTVYLCAADERGMHVSLIQSNYMGFGSGVVVPGT